MQKNATLLFVKLIKSQESVLKIMQTNFVEIFFIPRQKGFFFISVIAFVVKCSCDQ